PTLFPYTTLFRSLPERRVGKFGNELLIEVLRLIGLLVRLVQRRQFVCDCSFGVPTPIIDLLVDIDRLLSLTMLLVNGARCKLRYAFDTRVSYFRNVLKRLSSLCRIAEPFLAQRNVVDRNIGDRQRAVLIVSLLCFNDRFYVTLLIGFDIDGVIERVDCLR